MSDAPKGLPLSSSRLEQIFPKLAPEQISRVAVQGHIRAILPGEMLVEQGDSVVPFFVVDSVLFCASNNCSSSFNRTLLNFLIVY
jgi:hypothetical protein